MFRYYSISWIDLWILCWIVKKTVYLEYPSSEPRGLAHVGVRLDLMD